MKQFKNPLTIFLAALLLSSSGLAGQPCTTLGQTPSTAFPVCGITTFQQNNVPVCATNDLFVPGCSGTGGALYQNKNPFFYKFTCYTSGTLGFLITPNAADEDYDWQLYDITGRNPDDIFTNNSLVVTGNWSGSYGPTGASSAGANFIQCASSPPDNAPTFAKMPALIAGHEYLLMISHFTDTQSGYALSFGGGTAVITDPALPHMVNAVPDCNGTKITMKLNKRMRCKSITGSGSEFSVLPAATTVVSAVTTSCSAAFDFDELTITLATALPNGNYQLVINNGTDANTLLDNCGLSIAQGEQVSFNYFAPQPILADSVAKAVCSPDSILVFYPKKIQCSTISATGSDFAVNGPTAVRVTSAYGNCVNDLTSYIIIKLAAPLYTAGNYMVAIQPGIDGSPVFDACGQPILPQTLAFQTADTVSALFQYTGKYGCQRDTLTFTHDGAHNVNKWNWVFNAGASISTQAHTIIFPASSTNAIQLTVSNGVCRDTASSVVVLGNEVKASFTMPDIICPEDPLVVTNTSTGQISSWRWNYDVLATSTEKNPLPFLFPGNGNREASYTVKLVVYNNVLGCNDSARRTVTVLDHCFIGVPNAFTPNNDGRNDFFRPHNALKADNYTFQVFNRWGQRVFYSRNWKDKWDGRINGALQGTGVYVWMLSYTHRDTGKPFFQKGTVTLIR